MGKVRDCEREIKALNKYDSDMCARCGLERPLLRYGTNKNLCWACRNELKEIINSDRKNEKSKGWGR